MKSFEERIFEIEKRLENTMDEHRLQTYNENMKRDLNNWVETVMSGITNRVFKLENEKMDQSICLEKLDSKANQDNLEKFMQNVFDLKKEIEKSIDIQVNGYISGLKQDISVKVNLKDIDVILEN